MRREFTLPEGDREHLEARGRPWEAVVQGSSQWLLVHEFEVPEGYNHERATAALLIPPQYQDAQIDMVYFSPPMARKDGKPIPKADHNVTIGGVVFQRWSRHHNGEDPWRPGVDDVGTYLLRVTEWLRREFRVRP
jgi:hypothetical protein